MEQIELVIRIPKDFYDELKKNKDYYEGALIYACIIDGTPLPKRKVGKWVIKHTKESQVIFPHCSCCDWYSYNWVMHPFCPNCGAKMEGAEE